MSQPDYEIGLDSRLVFELVLEAVPVPVPVPVGA